MEKFVSTDSYQKDDIVEFDHNHDGHLRGRIYGIAQRYKKSPHTVKEYHVVVGTESYHIAPSCLHHIRQTIIEVTNQRGRKRKTTIDSSLFKSVITAASLHIESQLKRHETLIIDFSRATYPEQEFENAYDTYKSFLERQKEIDELEKLWETKK